VTTILKRKYNERGRGGQKMTKILWPVHGRPLTSKWKQNYNAWQASSDFHALKTTLKIQWPIKVSLKNKPWFNFCLDTLIYFCCWEHTLWPVDIHGQKISFYRNIVCKNVSCDVGLKASFLGSNEIIKQSKASLMTHPHRQLITLEEGGGLWRSFLSTTLLVGKQLLDDTLYFNLGHNKAIV